MKEIPPEVASFQRMALNTYNVAIAEAENLVAEVTSAFRAENKEFILKSPLSPRLEEEAARLHRWLGQTDYQRINDLCKMIFDHCKNLQHIASSEFIESFESCDKCDQSVTESKAEMQRKGKS